MNEPLVLEEWEGRWAVLRPEPWGHYFLGFFEKDSLRHHGTGTLVALCPTREAAVAALRLLS